MTITEAAACGTPAVVDRDRRPQRRGRRRHAPACSSTIRPRSAGAIERRARRPRSLRDRLSGRRARSTRRAFTWGATARGDARGAWPAEARRRPPVVSSGTVAAPATARFGRAGTPSSAAASTPPPRLGYGRPRADLVRAAAAHRSPARSPPTPSSTSTSTRPPAVARRRRCGTRTSAWARSRTRTSATCFPMGPYYWALRHISACPTGSRSACGSARCCSPPGAACCTCCARSAARTGGAVVAALAYMFTPYVARLRGAHLGDPDAVGRPRLDARHASSEGCGSLRTLQFGHPPGRLARWRHPAIFALIVALVGAVNATA